MCPCKYSIFSCSVKKEISLNLCGCFDFGAGSSFFSFFLKRRSWGGGGGGGGGGEFEGNPDATLTFQEQDGSEELN